MKKESAGWIGPVALLLALIIGVLVFTDGMDASAYDAGHAALAELDCPRAIAEFDKVISAPRLIDLRSYAFLARREKAQCELFQQGLNQESAGAPGDAAASYFMLASTYAESPLLEQAKERIRAIVNGYRVQTLASEAFCREVTQQPAGGTLLMEISSQNHPRLVDACGRMYERRGEYRSAVKTYNNFLQAQSSNNWAEEFRQAMARSMLNDVSARSPGQLAVPLYTAPNSGPKNAGKIIITFYNDSPDPVQVIMVGPSTQILNLEPCRGCQTYPAPGPAACPKQGRAVTYEMPEGRYTVVLESGAGDDAKPFLGSWSLGTGQYESCFTKVQ